MPIGAFPLRHLPVTRARGASLRSVFALLCATTGLVGADGWPDAAAQTSAGAPAAAPPSAPAAAPAAPKPAAASKPMAPKPATPAAKGGAKTPATKPAPGPAEPKLLPPPKAVTLSKADVFQRASAATVMLIAKQDAKWQTALGTIVKPQGVVVSDTRLLGGVEKGQIFAFTYDPAMSADEDPMLYLNAHKEQALPVQVVRADTGTHLLMLQLPALPPKKTYPYLELYDMRGITVGVDVISINTRGRQTLALGSGSVVAMRPDLIEVEPGLGEQNAGGPVLTLGGRLIGVATYADKSVNASGVARPTDVLRDLLAGKLGVAPGAPAEGGAPTMVEKPQAEVPSDARNAVEAVRIGLGALLAQKLDKHAALQLHSEFITAMAARGKHLVREVETGEQLNAMTGSLAKLNESQGKVVAELFPMLVADKKGAVWRKVGTKYEAVRPTAFGLGAVDDVTGALYAVDPKRQLIYYDAPGKSWRNTGITPVQQVRASQGSLYVLLMDGHVLKADSSGHDSMQVFPRSVKSGTIEASQGILYVVEGGQVFRYRDGKWDNKLGAIAHAMTKLVVRGVDWYGMDITGKVFSSTAQRYIDRDANVELMWPVGKDLLVLTRKNERLLFRLGSGEWQNWSQW